ncbi:hypothetical protein ACJIZ3_015019 [Penstemon smallii]|uniref:Uncharacterized protein n=1 Tax=Penstemon smallii TaxID=265156 RepID=A0ABD3RPP7_9LAMI
MAGSNSQKQLLNLIRDFSTEKSQGERRIVNQKKQIDELRFEIEAANSDLEEAKRRKEITEQELKGCEVEISMNEASVQALEARNALINNEVSALGSAMVAIKSEENSLRDGFIQNMLQMNADIRQFQELLASYFNADNRCETILNGGSLTRHEHGSQTARETLQDKLAKIMLQINHEEQQYNAEQVIHNQVQQELFTLEKKALLLDSLMEESMELQELSKYPCYILSPFFALTENKQTSELEEKCAALSDELQKRFLCPRCHQDNSDELGDSLQMSQMSQMSEGT